MKDIRHATAYTEAQIMDAVASACRANELREMRNINELGKYRFTVRFMDYGISTTHTGALYCAKVYDTNGFKVGSATVDKSDI